VTIARPMGAGAVCLLFAALTGCANGESAEGAPAEAEGQQETTTATMDMDGGLVNPNLAGREEMASLPGMNEEGLSAIMDGRPFLSVASFHDAISAHVAADDIEGLYGHLWVPLDLNSATAEEILLIPGVGDRMLHEFEEYRPYEGMPRFEREMAKYVDDAEVGRMAQYVFVQIDLNTATEEEILGVPGVGERMKHEFEEYRPYTSMEQFRREMGKYVDDGEVNRLARYVTIR